jgi:ATP-dependent RNA helicase DDX19/DBP5
MDDLKAAPSSVEDDEIPAKATQLIDSTHEVIVKLADPHADPKASLFAASTWEELQVKADLLKGLYAMNFQKPSKIQGKALPLLMAKP